jgi:GT2 family glycosyltransferase
VTNPSVSICIPAFKAERHLPETLASVRAQTFADWELVVTEDGSRDGTERIVREFAATVPQPVRYTRHDPNRGLPATRNAGIAAARGEWIALLDADDVWLPDHLAGLVHARDGGADLVFAGSRIFEDGTGTELGLRDASPETLGAPARSLFTGKLVIQPSAVLLRRSLVERVGGFDPAYPVCNDVEFWLRLLSAGARLVHSGRATCRYRKHAGAMSHRSAELIADLARVREAYFDRAGLEPREGLALAASAFLDAARIARSAAPRRALAWTLSALRLHLRRLALTR